MRAYIAFFYGDLMWHDNGRGMKPMANSSLEDLLSEIVKETSWGKRISVTDEHWDEFTCDGYYSPDPEDDKIEIWEIDTENNSCKVVWGFWGWHWEIPDELEQGILPGHTKSLYELAMEE